MPKTISRSTTEQIKRLKDEERLSFVAIGKKLNLHGNTVSRLYRENEQGSQNLPQENQNRATSNPTEILDSTLKAADEELTSTRKAIETLKSGVQKYLYDSTLGIEMLDGLNEIGLYTQDQADDGIKNAIQNFKEKHGFQEFSENELADVAVVCSHLFNETFFKNMSRSQAVEYLVNLLQEHGSLQKKIVSQKNLYGQLRSLVIRSELRMEELNQQVAKLLFFKKMIFKN